jgi:2,3-bisphosphoglycerate-dependent phosphoglycerate mutase
MAYLILVRHGKSEWNELGLWTGWEDVELNETGKEDAKRAGESLIDIDIHVAHTSNLKRAQQTLEIIKEHVGKKDIPTHPHQALNERHYGIYQGKNKWQIKDEVGEDTFHKIRRSWDHPIPEGETMADVHGRVVPHYEEIILKDLKEGKNVIVAAHGNSLRALVKHLENLSNEELANLEFGIGEVYIYEIDSEGKVVSKQIRAENPNKGKV